MMRASLILCALLVGAPLWATDVPSGQVVTLQEALLVEVDARNTLRMRFVAPAIARDGGTIDYDTAGADMEHLCVHVALPYAVQFELDPDVIVISLSDRETEFGALSPEATQFFDAFRVEDQTCIWEAF